MKKNEQGRSMVEMLAVLGIIGVLSIGGYAGYKLAIQRIFYQKVLNTAVHLAGQGTGGKSFKNLAAAGMDLVYNMDMALSESGTVCIKSFNAETGSKSGFRSFASQYSSATSSISVKGENISCDVALQIGKQTR